MKRLSSLVPRGSRYWLSVIACLSTATACSPEALVTNGHPTISQDVSDGGLDPEPTEAGPSLDDLFLTVAVEAPAFAGLFVDSGGSLVVQLTDTIQSDLVLQAVQKVFANEPGVRGRELRTNVVSYTFVQLREWRDAVLAGGAIVGLSTSDIDERANVVRFGVLDAATVDGIGGRVQDLGIPDAAVVAEVITPVRELTDYLSSAVRPVLGGLQIATTYAGCTLGFKAKKTGSTRYFVTNAHCTSTFGAVDSDQVGQPLLQSNYHVGTEVSDPAFAGGTGCPSGETCRYSDAALVQCDSVATCSYYHIARTTFEYSGSDWSQSGSFELAAEPWYVVGELGSGSLLQGTSLSKVGATSGWTGGTIQSTCVNQSLTGSRRLLCQYKFAAVSRPGDSGSPVFAYEASTGKAWLAGIMWGSDGYALTTFSPIAGIKTDLGAMTVSSPLY